MILCHICDMIRCQGISFNIYFIDFMLNHLTKPTLSVILYIIKEDVRPSCTYLDQICKHFFFLQLFVEKNVESCIFKLQLCLQIGYPILKMDTIRVDTNDPLSYFSSFFLNQLLDIKLHTQSLGHRVHQLLPTQRN